MSEQILPIILVHGIARFDVLLEIEKEKLKLPSDPLNDQIQYFRGIKAHLESHGFDAFIPNLDFAGQVALRAEQLKNNVNDIISNTGADQVHIIAHSMGGLDARRMIVDMDPADKVASLTTIGTPHRGTVIADRIINQGGKLLLQVLNKVIKLNFLGFSDLTVNACEQFNVLAEDTEARNRVFYQTYASYEDFNRVFVPLLPAWILLRNSEGRNDGLVSFKSQQWKKELIARNGIRKTIVQKEFPVPADHLNQIGWWDHEEAINPLAGGSLLEQKRQYENTIKNIYLEIAQDIQKIQVN